MESPLCHLNFQGLESKMEDERKGPNVSPLANTVDHLQTCAGIHTSGSSLIKSLRDVLQLYEMLPPALFGMKPFKDACMHSLKHRSIPSSTYWSLKNWQNSMNNDYGKTWIRWDAWELHTISQINKERAKELHLYFGELLCNRKLLTKLSTI